MKMNGKTYDGGTGVGSPAPVGGGLTRKERGNIQDFFARRGERSPAERRAALKAFHAAKKTEVKA